MATISVINKKSVGRRAKNFLGRALRMSLFASLGYGLYWFAPRVFNQVNLSLNEDMIYKLVEEGKYDEALKIFNSSVGRGVVIHKFEREKRAKFYSSVSAKKKKPLEKAAATNDYAEARSQLEQFRREPFFTKKDIQDLEKIAQRAHPDEIVKRAESDPNPFDRLALYTKAELEYDKLGETNQNIKDKIVRVSIEAIVDRYHSDINAQNARGDTFTNIEALSIYLERHRDSAHKIDEETLQKFTAESEKYAEQVLWPTFSAATINHLDIFRRVYSLLGITDSEAKVKGLANSFLDYCKDRLGKKQPIGLGVVADAGKINEKYSLGRVEDIVDLYLIYGEELSIIGATQPLTLAVSYSKVLPRRRQNEVKVRVADKFRALSEEITTADSLPILWSARNLYIEAGLGYSDPRIVATNTLIAKKLDIKPGNEKASQTLAERYPSALRDVQGVPLDSKKYK